VEMHQTILSVAQESNAEHLKYKTGVVTTRM
jgi:hypothetical protein